MSLLTVVIPRYGRPVMDKPGLQIHPDDDLVVALRDLRKGEEVHVNGQSIRLVDDVGRKHQFARRDVARGDTVRMYGVTVGRATRAVARGGAVRRDNLEHASASYESRAGAFTWEPPDVSPWADRTFDGFVRADKSVGTANHWVVVPMVFCENRNLEVLREAMLEALGYSQCGPYEDLVRRLAEGYRAGTPSAELLELDAAEGPPQGEPRLFPHVDGVKFLLHNLGCGGMRVDSTNLCHLLAGYINHPNVAGATILSLGCQNAEVQVLRDELHRRNPRFEKPLLVFEQQSYPNERAMMSEVVKRTFVGLAAANEARRRAAPLSKLTVGVECGASDGFSGISANPVIGQASDLLVALGGSAILSEFPELCGVEQELVDRCRDKETADRFVALMRAYEAQARAVGGSFDMNPSPGNIRDGLITDAIKSAGAARKGGTSPVVAALDYPQAVTEPGLNLLCTPGGDIESTTALAGAGANLILFSTGLGTPTGNPVAPVIKVSSN
ncbi:MAG: altronate dehydratase, partial [Akkermansiaceae bacterium]|nr:altronate dehydratase [Akkermansiaceae bacterium]